MKIATFNSNSKIDDKELLFENNKFFVEDLGEITVDAINEINKYNAISWDDDMDTLFYEFMGVYNKNRGLLEDDEKLEEEKKKNKIANIKVTLGILSGILFFGLFYAGINFIFFDNFNTDLFKPVNNTKNETNEVPENNVTLPPPPTEVRKISIHKNSESTDEANEKDNNVTITPPVNDTEQSEEVTETINQ